MKHLTYAHRRAPQRGMTLVELLVALVIGLVVTLAVTSIVTLGEAQKRSTTSTNDMNQSGAFAAYAIDRMLRSAGSGFAQSWNLGMFGCRLSASRDIGGAATTILPRNAAFPAPFQNFLGGGGAALSGNLRMAPFLIGKGQSASGSDVIMVMGGNAAAGDVPRAIRSGVVATNNFRLDNTIGLANGDIGLVMQQGVEDCLIEQVNAPDAAAVAAMNTTGNEVLPIGGRYLTTSGPTTSLATLSASTTSFFTPLGNVTANNVQLQLIGVGANRTLFAYDLLRSAGNGTDAEALQQLADGVLEMHALYGVDNTNDGIVDSWVDPGAAGYTIATLLATPATMRQIVAARVALVVRSSLYEKEPVAPATITVFGDQAAALQRTVTITGDATHFRHRVIDTSIPLRNMLMLPN